MDKTKRDVDRFRSAIGGMAVTFRQEASEILFDGYWMGLADLPIEVVERAVVQAIRECKFMPTVAELRESAGQIRPEQRATVAWSVLQDASRDNGYSTVVFDDPILTATVRRMGGWPAVCEYFDVEPHQWLEGVFQKRFTDLYTSLLARGISETEAAPLPGFFEQDNRLHGYLDAIPATKCIACDLPALPVEKTRRLPRPPTELVPALKAP